MPNFYVKMECQIFIKSWNAKFLFKNGMPNIYLKMKSQILFSKMECHIFDLKMECHIFNQTNGMPHF